MRAAASTQAETTGFEMRWSDLGAAIIRQLENKEVLTRSNFCFSLASEMSFTCLALLPRSGFGDLSRRIYESQMDAAVDNIGVHNVSSLYFIRNLQIRESLQRRVL
jgi:hypothetical protein